MWSTTHCVSRERLWLQVEAASQMQSFREADPQPVIGQNKNKIMEYTNNQLILGLNIILTTTYLCLPSRVSESTGTQEQRSEAERILGGRQGKTFCCFFA